MFNSSLSFFFLILILLPTPILLIFIFSIYLSFVQYLFSYLLKNY